tara:strand:- start:123 stop:2306 length:2184 start_codon:yes stop_codon:yes gene_type:complete
MAEQDLDLSQISSEKTAVSSDSKLGNIIGILQGQNTITDEVKEETKKTRSDLGKQHNWKKTADKEESKKSALIAASLNMIKSSSKYMSGILKGMDLRALRAMKDAMKEKMGAGWQGIKNVASNLTKTTKDIMGALLKGLGLVALWWLLSWLQKQDFQKLYTDIKGFFENFQANITTWINDLRAWMAGSTIGSIILSLVDTLVEFNGVIGGIATIVATWKTVAWIANFAGSSLKLLWNALKLIFGVGGLIGGLVVKVTKWTTTLMFGEEGALRKLWSGIKAVFGLGGTIAGLVGKVATWATAGLFGETGPLMKLWNGIKNFFGIGGQLSKSPAALRTAEELVDLKFTKEGPLMKLWNGIKSIFGAEGKIATFWNSIKGGLKFLETAAKESAIGKFIASIGAAFGPEGKLASVGTFFTEKWDKIKGFFSTGKEGGPIAKIMGFFGNISSSISGAWTNMKSAKWFTGLSKVLTGAKGVVSALLTPLRFLLMPLTWLLGIGAAVWGFVQGFMGKEGVKDERSLGTKIMDGLKGAFRGLLDFFVIDLVMMVQDVMNWFVDQWNNSIFGKVKQFGKFTFGEELRETTDKMLEPSQGSKLEVRKASLNVDDLLEKSGGELVDKKGIGTGDKFVMSTEDFGKMVDKLGIGGLAQVQDRLLEMDANKNVDLINKDALIKRLQEEVAERAAAAQPTIIDNSVTDNSRKSGGGERVLSNATSFDQTSAKNQFSDKPTG